MKRIVSFILGFALVLGLFSPVVAQDVEVSEATSEADVMGTEDEVAEVNSFELFWPVVAGKTRGDSLYFLKSLKEKVIGILVFGDAKKADYLISLATKRVVEAEKLLLDGKEDLAIKTLDEAEENVVKSREYWDGVDNKANEGDIMINIKNQLTNIEVFLNFLETDNEGVVKNEIVELNEIVANFIINL